MRHTLTVALLVTVVILTGCGQQNNSSHQHKAVPKQTQPQSVTFTKQTLKTTQGTIKLGTPRLVASALPNRQQFLIPYTFHNTSKKQLVPDDTWTKYISATQAGQSLTTGSLSITGGNSDTDNDAINDSVSPVDAGQTKTVGAMYKVNPTAGPVTLIVKAHQKIIGKLPLPLPAN
ncbi:DUF5067 domain-containing protein [Furfurilactobacillus siliginis]|nr:DUF5067 domain-containing protein [Furfurilactobacillus siliginis]